MNELASLLVKTCNRLDKEKKEGEYKLLKWKARDHCATNA